MRRRRSRIAILVIAFISFSAALLWRQRAVGQRTLMMRTGPDAILGRPDLRAVALHDGKAVFLAHCAACHRANGKGSTEEGVPNLTDDDFLYGQNTVGEIEQIVLHGIRAGDSHGWNLAEMPGFAKAVPYAREKLPSLTPRQIDDLVVFLRAANGTGGYDPAQVGRGRTLFQTSAGCWDCHEADARGDPAIGSPNLVDGTWLKGQGSEADIRHILERGLAGVSPAFRHKISAYDVRVVAVYTASLHPPVR